MHPSFLEVHHWLHVQRLGYVLVLFPIPINWYTFLHQVVLTDPSVTTDLYPSGARAVLGYGLLAPASSPPDTSLVPTFLGWVDVQFASLHHHDRDWWPFLSIRKNFTGNAVCGIELNHFNDPFPDGFLTMGAVDSSAWVPLKIHCVFDWSSLNPSCVDFPENSPPWWFPQPPPSHGLSLSIRSHSCPTQRINL